MFVNPLVMDRGLEYLQQRSQRLVLLTQEVDTYAEAISPAVALGLKQAPVLTGPMDGTQPQSRRLIVQPIADGQVIATGNATSWALLDDEHDRLLVCGALNAPLDVVNGNSFTLEAFDIYMVVIP